MDWVGSNFKYFNTFKLNPTYGDSKNQLGTTQSTNIELIFQFL